MRNILLGVCLAVGLGLSVGAQEPPITLFVTTATAGDDAAHGFVATMDKDTTFAIKTLRSFIAKEGKKKGIVVTDDPTAKVRLEYVGTENRAITTRPIGNSAFERAITPTNESTTSVVLVIGDFQKPLAASTPTVYLGADPRALRQVAEDVVKFLTANHEKISTDTRRP